MSHLFLKIKIKSLVDEVATIRREERLLPREDPRRAAMIQHRRWDIARESRCSLLAYAYLRGRPYAALEASTPRNPLTPVLIKRVATLVNKYGPDGAADGLLLWLAGAETPRQSKAA